MVRALRTISIFLLLFNAAGAVYGGILLMMDPSGGMLQLPQIYLEHSPFRDYFIPGLVLFCCNGLLSLFITALTILRTPRHPWWIMTQGAVLSGWLVIQMIMIQLIYFLHYVMGAAGLLLLLCGWLLLRKMKHQEIFVA